MLDRHEAKVHRSVLSKVFARPENAVSLFSILSMFTNMQESVVNSTHSLDPYGAVGVQTIHEALEDSMCLQALTRSLLDTLQGKYDDLQQQALSGEGDVASENEVTKRNIEKYVASQHSIGLRRIVGIVIIMGRMLNEYSLILSIENIRKDVDANIETFNNPHSKTFFQSNIEQLTAIYQLLFILPSLRPFIPDKFPDAAVFEPQPTSTLPSNGIKSESDESMESKDAAPACFDRVPRSLSSIPFAIQSKSELKMASPVKIQY